MAEVNSFVSDVTTEKRWGPKFQTTTAGRSQTMANSGQKTGREILQIKSQTRKKLIKVVMKWTENVIMDINKRLKTVDI